MITFPPFSISSLDVSKLLLSFPALVYVSVFVVFVVEILEHDARCVVLSAVVWD